MRGSVGTRARIEERGFRYDFNVTNVTLKVDSAASCPSFQTFTRLLVEI